MLTTCLGGWWVGGRVGGWGALEEWKLRLTSAKVVVEVEAQAELGNKTTQDHTYHKGPYQTFHDHTIPSQTIQDFKVPEDQTIQDYDQILS